MRYDENKPVCKSAEEIDEYIKDVEVQHWVVEEQIYWKIYGRKPVYTLMKQQNFQLLNPNYYYRQFVYLRKNQIETEDHYIDLGQSEEFTFYNIERQLEQTLVMDS
jgi:predicted RNA-binding protein associated with RNAse of E/G family